MVTGTPLPAPSYDPADYQSDLLNALTYEAERLAELDAELVKLGTKAKARAARSSSRKPA
jgi:hypothetical protein